MDQFMEDWLKGPRFRTILLGFFAGLALLIASIGIFGATAYLVNQRTHEMGIRLALGARPGDLVKMILRYCLMVAGIGLGLGLGGAVVLTRLLSTILFEVKPLDPLCFTVAPLCLAGLALLASLIPALKAAKINPKNLLQCE